MSDYAIFGSCLRSEIVFPELRTIENAVPRWSLRVCQARPALAGAELLGKDDVGDGTEARLYKSAVGYRLEYDDNTGAFDVSADGRSITWFPVPNPDEALVRLHVMGRVLATALHASGTFCLHGSGVVLRGEAIGFLGPRFWGKSTLALALTRSGARLLSDDTLAVQPGEIPLRLWPGVHSVRLWGDSAGRLTGDDSVGGAPHFDVKRSFTGFADRLLACHPVPLSALYLLAPTQGNGHPPVANRSTVTAVRAALSLVAHAKIGALLGKSEAPRLLDRAVRVASRVSVYRLEFPRDFESLDAVVAQLRQWHQGAAVARAVTP